MPRITVLTTVDFNNDSSFVRGEIRKIWTDGRLASKMRGAGLDAPKMPPQLSLGVRHRAAQGSRTSDARIFLSRSLCSHARPPTPTPPDRFAGGGEGTTRVRIRDRDEIDQPSTRPIERTASSTRLASASQNARNSG
jgi:hypothetical protein